MSFSGEPENGGGLHNLYRRNLARFPQWYRASSIQRSDMHKAMNPVPNNAAKQLLLGCNEKVVRLERREILQAL
jgi:hypothetical protein